MTIVLKRDDQAGFDHYLHDIYDRHSKNFHHYLRQREIADRFGPSEKSYQEVVAYLADNGLAPAKGPANRLTITVHGTRAQIGRALNLTIGDYWLGDRNFYANDKDPAFPTPIAMHIESVGGLASLARPARQKDRIILALFIAVCITFFIALFNPFGIETITLAPAFLPCVWPAWGRF